MSVPSFHEGYLSRIKWWIITHEIQVFVGENKLEQSHLRFIAGKTQITSKCSLSGNKLFYQQLVIDDHIYKLKTCLYVWKQGQQHFFYLYWGIDDRKPFKEHFSPLNQNLYVTPPYKGLYSLCIFNGAFISDTNRWKKTLIYFQIPWKLWSESSYRELEV